MALCIHFDGKGFAIWSSITDSYITWPMSKMECVRYLNSIRNKYDTYPWIMRAMVNGCSMIPDEIRCEKIKLTIFCLRIKHFLKKITNRLYIADDNHTGENLLLAMKLR